MHHVQAMEHLLDVLGPRRNGEVQARRADLVALTAELIAAVLSNHGACDSVAAARIRVLEQGLRPAAAASGHALGAAASGAAIPPEARPLLACAVQAMGHLIPLLHAAPCQTGAWRCNDPQTRRAVGALGALWRCALSLPGVTARALPAATADKLARAVGAACNGSPDPCPNGVPGALGAHTPYGRMLARQLLDELLRRLHADVLRAGQGFWFTVAAPAPSAHPSHMPGCGASAVLVRLARDWAHLSLLAPPAFATAAADQLAVATELLDPNAGCVTPIALSLGVASALRSAFDTRGLKLRAADIGRLPGAGESPSAVPPNCAAAMLRMWALAADALARGLADGRCATACVALS